jgi:hypothetical protein
VTSSATQCTTLRRLNRRPETRRRDEDEVDILQMGTGRSCILCGRLHVHCGVLVLSTI